MHTITKSLHKTPSKYNNTCFIHFTYNLFVYVQLTHTMVGLEIEVLNQHKLLEWKVNLFLKCQITSHSIL